MRTSLNLAPASSHAERSRPANDDPVRRGGDDSGPATILVVEDEVLIRLAVADYLRTCGYRVLEASTGEEAQAVFGNDEHIEVLLTDIDLGRGMNGFELARWARGQHPNVRIMLTSGVSRMAQTAGELCELPLFKKPYPHEQLAEEIRRRLNAMRHAGPGD
ncbi:MAG: response regulator [Alphaproteobacteria bacterium]|nr:response regulator [Alphaproteobacteria bacterium]